MAEFNTDFPVDDAVEELAQVTGAEGWSPDIHLRAEALEWEFKRHRHRWSEELAFARFMEQITEDDEGCWCWEGPMHRDYPVFSPAPTEWNYATMYAMEQSGHPRYDDKLVIWHSCENSMCVNPAHLRWVYRSEKQTKLAKQRAAKDDERTE